MRLIIGAVAAVLIAAVPPAVAQDGSGKPYRQHDLGSEKHQRGVSGYAPRHEMQTMRSNDFHPGISGYSPADPGRFDRNLESSRQAGGGGSGM